MQKLANVMVHKKGQLHYLKKANNKLHSLGYIELRKLMDPKGVFSVEYPKFYLTANAYAWKGYIVSNQKEIINRARLHKKKILLYVGDMDKFFIFNPQDIIENCAANRHGYLSMLNYDLSLGSEFHT